MAIRLILAAILAAVLIAATGSAYAYREGHENSPPEVRAWFQRQKQPDSNPLFPSSCCGDYDAYEADEFVTEGDQYYAIITDGKGTIAAGTRVLIPPNKMPQDNHDPNPSGHGIVFMAINRDANNVATPSFVFCYFPPAGL